MVLSIVVSEKLVFLYCKTRDKRVFQKLKAHGVHTNISNLEIDSVIELLIVITPLGHSLRYAGAHEDFCLLQL